MDADTPVLAIDTMHVGEPNHTGPGTCGPAAHGGRDTEHHARMVQLAMLRNVLVCPLCLPYTCRAAGCCVRASSNLWTAADLQQQARSSRIVIPAIP